MSTAPVPTTLNGAKLIEELAVAGIVVGPFDFHRVDDTLHFPTVADEATLRQVVAAHTGGPTTVESNERTQTDRLITGYDAMKAHVDRGTFTNTQRDAALLLCLRGVMALIRITLRRLDATD